MNSLGARVIEDEVFDELDELLLINSGRTLPDLPAEQWHQIARFVARWTARQAGRRA